MSCKVFLIFVCKKEKEKRLSYEADVAVLAHELIQFEREAWITEACLG